ncbi:MAG: hypothetical protein JRI72_02975 [Deltaproteobacteria bacterium]|nr:hypothetical protein [Deltaproteobacteria bacterium]
MLFDDNWFDSASKKQRGNQWIDDVMDQINVTGGIYLNTLRLWFERFPGSKKQKKHLKDRIESFTNSDHLGGVNEIAWWEFVNSFGWTAKPIDAGKRETPDFNVIKPEEFFCEITTLNLSEKERSSLDSGEGVSLDHNRSIERIIKKVVSEKAGQIKYGASRKKPSVLVLFDYTFWSAFATQFYRALANFLLGDNLGFMKLPTELSGIIYVERKVMDGKIGIGRDRSAVYHNPNALYKVPDTVFRMIRQYLIHMKEVPPIVTQDGPAHWFWL